MVTPWQDDWPVLVEAWTTGVAQLKEDEGGRTVRTIGHPDWF